MIPRPLWLAAIAASITAPIFTGNLMAEEKPAVKPAPTPKAIPATPEAQTPKPNLIAAAGSRNSAERYRKLAEEAAAKALTSQGRVKAAYEERALANRNTAAAYDAITKAQEAGDAEAARRANGDAVKAETWSRRVSEKTSIVEREIEMTQESATEVVRKSTPPAAKQEMEAYLAARQKLADAAAALGKVIVPETSDANLDSLRDAYYVAGLEMNYQMRAWNSARDIAARTVTVEKTNNPAIMNRLNELRAIDAELLRSIREQNAQLVKQRELDRKRAKIADTLSDEVTAAAKPAAK